MENATSITEALARIIGLYFLLGGLALWFRRAELADIMNRFKTNPALSYIAGVFVFVLGAVMLTVHPYWGGALACIVTLIGWAALIEGALLIVYPKPLYAFADSLMKSPLLVKLFAPMTFLAGVALIAGVYL